MLRDAAVAEVLIARLLPRAAVVLAHQNPRATALAIDRALMAPRLTLRPKAVLVLLDARPTLVTLVLPLRGLRDRNEPPDADAGVLALVAPKVTRLQLPLVPRAIAAALLDALFGEEVAREHVFQVDGVRHHLLRATERAFVVRHAIFALGLGTPPEAALADAMIRASHHGPTVLAVRDGTLLRPRLFGGPTLRLGARHSF